jgi:ATP-binding cassette subfamily F protein uup
MEQVHAEEARAADKLDAKLKIEEHWLHRGVTARRKRNMGRLEKLHEMRAERAAMSGPQGAAKLALASDDTKTKSVIVAEHVTKRFGIARSSRTSRCASARRPHRPGRRQWRGQDHAAQNPDRRTQARRRHGHPRPDAQRRHHRPAAQPDGPDKRVRDVLAEGGDWIDVRGVRKHIHGYLKDFLFDPGLVEARVGTLGRRALAPAARARICPPRTCWSSTNRPTTSTWKRSTCCRK